ncbi:MAG: hypothetical protein ACLPXB_08200 [Thiobacillaceae bacterium]
MMNGNGKSTQPETTPPDTKSVITGSDKPSLAAKPVPRPRAVKKTPSVPANPTRKGSPTGSKAPGAGAKKPVKRPTVAKKTPPAKKPARITTSAGAKPTAKAAKAPKAKKAKLVRDSFTMPEDEYALIALLKKRCINAGVPAKKSEILRAAVANLAKLSDTAVLAVLRRLATIKTGRPAKGGK